METLGWSSNVYPVRTIEANRLESVPDFSDKRQDCSHNSLDFYPNQPDFYHNKPINTTQNDIRSASVPFRRAPRSTVKRFKGIHSELSERGISMTQGVSYPIRHLCWLCPQADTYPNTWNDNQRRTSSLVGLIYSSVFIAIKTLVIVVKTKLECN